MGGTNQRRDEDRRHLHEDCTAHSGMNARLNINLVLNGIACVILAFLLSIAVDTHSSIKGQEWRIDRNKSDIDELGSRLAMLERSQPGR